MAIQHRDIPDAERHEPKGASTATAGQVLSADGAGAATFVNPNTLTNITLSSTLENTSTVDQSPTAVDTPLQVSFGPLVANSDVSIAAIGTVTILTAGVYSITFNMNMGRTNNVGTSILFARLLVNDTPTGFVQVNKIEEAINVRPFNAQVMRAFSANDTIKVQVIRDSAGANDGGLITLNPVLSGWADSPSAAIRIQKITGAS